MRGLGLLSFAVGALIGAGVGSEILHGSGLERDTPSTPKFRVSATPICVATKGARAQKLAPAKRVGSKSQPAPRKKRTRRAPRQSESHQSLSDLIARGFGH
jgi:hypothetical protein